MASYHRRLKLMAYFSDRQKERERTPFVLPSSWEPEDAQLPVAILDLIDADRTSLATLQPFLERNNIVRAEWEALQDLSNNRALILKSSDKGSCTVLMERSLYVAEAMRQLSDRDFYLPLEDPMFMETAEMLKTILTRMESLHILTKKQLAYFLDNDPPKPRQFYLLPKIHKDRQTWPHEQMPSGRPIVSDCGSESYHLSSYIDSYLNPLSTRHPSYIKDTIHFLEKVRALRLGRDVFLFSMDVSSLYTNIVTEDGLEAVRQCFHKYPDPHRPDAYLLQLLEMGLTRNDFQFNGKCYLQVRGCAMGRRFAPSYANIYMWFWEEAALAGCSLRPLHYFRYLDDIFGVWPHSREDFDTWVNQLNEHHPTIKLTAVCHESEVNFLDVTVFKAEDFLTTGILHTTVFFKSTDTRALLHRDSFHPPHTFRGIIKSQLIRYDRICSREKDRDQAISSLFSILKKRGYTYTFLRNVHQDWLDSKGRYKVPPPRMVLPIISKYSKRAVSMHTHWKRNLRDAREALHPFLEGTRVLSAYCRNRNLRDYLVRAKLQDPHSKPPKPLPRRIVRNHTTGRVFSLPIKLPLSTPNCVYVVKCLKCHKLYVGETLNSVSHRRSTHLYNIRRGLVDTTLTQHFRKHGIRHFRIYTLAHHPNWSLARRRWHEWLWIRRLDSWEPVGLNTRGDLGLTTLGN